MKALAITNRGIEDISAKEIEGLISAKTQIIDEGVLFEGKLEDILFVCYKAQSLKKVLIVLYEGSVENFSLKNSELMKADTFVLEGKNGKNDEEKIIGLLKKNEYKLEYKNPELHFFYTIVDDKLYFCIDISEEDLARRDYRMFLKAESYKGNIAFAMLKLADYKDKEVLLDVFCRDGIIGIEAGLYATGKSPHYYNKEKFYFRKMKAFADLNYDKFFEAIDKKIKEKETSITLLDNNFANIQAARKNAKIAGILKQIKFSRESIEWLDAKFENNSIDKIAGFPIQIGSMMGEKAVEKIYKQLFYQANFILKKNGKVVFGLKRGVELMKKWAGEYKFKVRHERTVKQGKEDVYLIMFEKE